MKLSEIFLTENVSLYADSDFDIENPPKVRANRLTLRHLNRLRKMRELKRSELIRDLSVLGQIYNQE